MAAKERGVVNVGLSSVGCAGVQHVDIPAMGAIAVIHAIDTAIAGLMLIDHAVGTEKLSKS